MERTNEFLVRADQPLSYAEFGDEVSANVQTGNTGAACLTDVHDVAKRRR